MRWPWCWRHEAEQARQELAAAQQRLEEARRVGEEVSVAAEELRELRRRNRFGLMITEALRGTQ